MCPVGNDTHGMVIYGDYHTTTVYQVIHEEWDG